MRADATHAAGRRGEHARRRAGRRCCRHCHIRYISVTCAQANRSTVLLAVQKLQQERERLAHECSSLSDDKLTLEVPLPLLPPLPLPLPLPHSLFPSLRGGLTRTPSLTHSHSLTQGQVASSREEADMLAERVGSLEAALRQSADAAQVDSPSRTLAGTGLVNGTERNKQTSTQPEALPLPPTP